MTGTPLEQLEVLGLYLANAKHRLIQERPDSTAICVIHTAAVEAARLAKAFGDRVTVWIRVCSCGAYLGFKTHAFDGKPAQETHGLCDECFKETA